MWGYGLVPPGMRSTVPKSRLYAYRTVSAYEYLIHCTQGKTMTDPEFKDKHYKGQRVFAKDETSGILYEAVIRRTMYGIARQPQRKKDEFDDEEEEKPEWHCFVHYLGWNVKWDRWVSEDSLYEINDKTKVLAQKLQDAVREVKKKYGKGPQFMLELEKRMKRLEQEHVLEERREELAKQGIVEEEPSEQKLTKARLRKELANREQGLEGRRKQVHAEKLAMPFSSILVEEWEIITQCNMLPTLPARVTVQQALDSYLASKIGPPRELTDSKGTVLDTEIVDAPDKELVELSAKTGERNCDKRETSAEWQVQELKQGNATVETDEDKAASPESITSDGTRPDIPKEDTSSDEKQTKGWKDMVDGIALLFDQAIGTRLLYRQEVPQHEWIQKHKELGTLRYCQIYGCEHLLRLFLRLPALLEGEDKSRHIFSKLNDLVRYLQKHQSTLFLQSYHTPSKKRETDNAASGCAKRRKRKPLDSPSTLADVEESLSVDTASI